MERITTTAELAALAAAGAGTGRWYLDTEFHSARDGQTLSLVQLHDGARCWVIDALAVRDLRPLAPVLGADGVEWVLHAGRQDAALLTQALGLPAPPDCFDTQVAWALGSAEWSVSLAYCLFRVLGHRGDKGAQVEDWRRRPLPDAQWAYAAEDVRHLPALHAHLAERLTAAGRLAAVHPASREQVWPPPKTPTPLALGDFRNAWQLDAAQLAALRFLIGWFNGLDDDARRAAPARDGLFAIASALPESAQAMARLRPVPSAWARRHGDQLAGRVLAASAAAGGGRAPEAPPYATFEAIRNDGWLRHACAEVAAAVGMAPELAFPKAVTAALRLALDAGTPRAGTAAAIAGWRAPILADPWRAFAAAGAAP